MNYIKSEEPDEIVDFKQKKASAELYPKLPEVSPLLAGILVFILGLLLLQMKNASLQYLHKRKMDGFTAPGEKEADP